VSLRGAEGGPLWEPRRLLALDGEHELDDLIGRFEDAVERHMPMTGSTAKGLFVELLLEVLLSLASEDSRTGQDFQSRVQF
jgi:hypothetical protein